jgi:hypothetical protein
MEASVSTRVHAPLGVSASVPAHGHAPPGWNARAQTAEQRSYGRLLPLLFLGSVLAMYLVIGSAIYALVAALM